MMVSTEGVLTVEILSGEVLAEEVLKVVFSETTESVSILICPLSSIGFKYAVLSKVLVF